MSDRRQVKVDLDASVEGYIAKIEAAAAATDQLASKGDRASRDTKALGQSTASASANVDRLGSASRKAAADQDRLGRSIQTTQKLSDRSSLSIGSLVVAAAALGPGLVPLAGAATAAGIGLAGMGVAGGLAIYGISNAMKSSGPQAAAYASGLSSLKGNLDDLAATAAANVLGPFQSQVTGLQSRMPALTKSVAGLSSSFGIAASHGASGLLNIFQSLDPLMQTIGLHAVDLSAKFETWTKGSGMRDFASWAQSQLPAVEQMLAELIPAVGHLIAAFGPLGGQTVAAITALASAINAIPTPVLTALVTLAVQGGLAFKAWNGLAAIVGGLSGAMTRLGASSTASAAGMTAAGTAAKASAVGMTTATGAATRLAAAQRLLVAAAPVVGVAALASSLAQFQTQAMMGGHSASELSTELGALGKNANLSGEAFRMFGGGQGMGPFRNDVITTDEALQRFGVNARGHFASFNDGFTDWLGNLQDGSRRSNEFKESVTRMDGGLAQMVQSGHADQARASYEKLMSAIDPKDRPAVAAMFSQYNTALKETKTTAASAAPQVDAFGQEIKRTGIAAKDAAEATKRLADGYKSLGQGLLGERDSARGFQQAIDDANSAVKENGRTLDISTSKGRANQAALDGIASSATGYASSILKAGGSQAQANAVLAAGRSSFIQNATAMGMSKTQAEGLANSLFKLPKGVSTTVAVPGLPGASYGIDQFGQKVIQLDGRNVSIPVSTPGAQAIIANLAGISAKAMSMNGSKIVITPSAPLAAAVKRQIDGLASARVNADGTITIDSKAPSAAADTAKIRSLTSAAQTADKQSPNIHTSTDAPESRRSVEAATRAAQTLDKQSPTITTSTNANGTKTVVISLLNATKDKSARITYTTNAASAAGGVRSLLSTAVDVTRSITYKVRTIGGVARAGREVMAGNATGGIGGVLPGYQTGGEAFDALRGGQVRGPGSRTSDSVLAKGRAGHYALSNFEHVWTGDEVEKGGGHATQYAMRALARQGRLEKIVRAGMVAGYAGGGAASGLPGYAGGGESLIGWNPDISSIIQLTGSLRVDAQTISETKGRLKGFTDALAKANRDLRAARARRDGLDKHASHAQRVAAANAVTNALAKQAKAQDNVNAATASYNAQVSASKKTDGQLFVQATGNTSYMTRQFLDDLDTIRKKGQPKLALSLLQDGSATAQRTARSLAKGSASQLLAAARGVAYNDALEDRRAKLLGQLDGSTKKALQEKKAADLAAKQEKAKAAREAAAAAVKARRDANMALIGLRGATNQAYAMAGPQVSSYAGPSVRQIVTEVVGALPVPTVQPGQTVVKLDGRVIGQSTTTYQAQQASYGSTIPGVER
ncbi:hypothetical protein [Luteipulveratus halotolerans]|uniref:Uncharacterized protein n=1 Tax=Luteipulveratus halotolerans TaxID=1631356 RepID=A0A0L6CK06_9MICO|nr:hypothetical protein [Luteipulveratus halotolerans]KNX38107.1 hypothetical protein VV01_14685 [Luteipulveratus halotolerans]